MVDPPKKQWPPCLVAVSTTVKPHYFTYFKALFSNQANLMPA